jgi:NAD(P)-dependent dehydrogenase (short-subunit alcohol dehydrogenase family)
MERFQDKVVLITGGGTGIGEATAIGFAREGARVVVASRREAPLKNVVSRIKDAGGEATYFTVDVQHSDEIERLVAGTVEKYGRLDVAFNNAGMNITAPILETTDQMIDTCLGTNLKSVLYALRAEIRQMRKQGGGGAIVNNSSASGLMGHPNRAVYCASKGGVTNLTRAIALEVAPENIRINAICPWVIQSPMLDEGWVVDPVMVQSYLDATPMKRSGTSEEAADLVMFLCSDAASFLTGMNVPIDGGFCAGVGQASPPKK